MKTVYKGYTIYTGVWDKGYWCDLKSNNESPMLGRIGSDHESRNQAILAAQTFIDVWGCLLEHLEI